MFRKKTFGAMEELEAFFCVLPFLIASLSLGRLLT